MHRKIKMNGARTRGGYTYACMYGYRKIANNKNKILLPPPQKIHKKPTVLTFPLCDSGWYAKVHRTG